MTNKGTGNGKDKSNGDWLGDGLHPTLRGKTAKDGAPGAFDAGNSGSKSTAEVVWVVWGCSQGNGLSGSEHAFGMRLVLAIEFPQFLRGFFGEQRAPSLRMS
jgi:hypothetical protein